MFVVTSENGIEVWAGSPDCQAAHDQLLQALQTAGTQFLPSGTTLTPRRKGNMGEFIALTIGRTNNFARYRVIAANAFNPLSDMSHSGLDLLWFLFGETKTDDVGVVQEVKTTAGGDLKYADNLISDYGKLFDPDPGFTLQSRFNVAANIMEGMGLPLDLCCRARELSGISADTSPRVRLFPTLVHEADKGESTPKLLTVKSTIVQAQGWKASAIYCWSIILQDLENRLSRLTWGQH